MVHKSLDVAQPGDVVVVDTSASSMNAVLGDLICTKARHRGIAGFIVDGLIRDLPAIQALGDFPVFARGVTPIGPLHRGPGEINHPISRGGIVVNPGDVIVGDRTASSSSPPRTSARSCAGSRSSAAAESDYTDAVARGDFSNDWVDTILDAHGVVAESDPGQGLTARWVTRAPVARRSRGPGRAVGGRRPPPCRSRDRSERGACACTCSPGSRPRYAGRATATGSWRPRRGPAPGALAGLARARGPGGRRRPALRGRRPRARSPAIAARLVRAAAIVPIEADDDVLLAMLDKDAHLPSSPGRVGVPTPAHGSSSATRPTWTARSRSSRSRAR